MFFMFPVISSTKPLKSVVNVQITHFSWFIQSQKQLKRLLNLICKKVFIRKKIILFFYYILVRTFVDIYIPFFLIKWDKMSFYRSKYFHLQLKQKKTIITSQKNKLFTNHFFNLPIVFSKIKVLISSFSSFAIALINPFMK